MNCWHWWKNVKVVLPAWTSWCRTKTSTNLLCTISIKSSNNNNINNNSFNSVHSSEISAKTPATYMKTAKWLTATTLSLLSWFGNIITGKFKTAKREKTSFRRNSASCVLAKYSLPIETECPIKLRLDSHTDTDKSEDWWRVTSKQTRQRGREQWC